MFVVPGEGVVGPGGGRWRGGGAVGGSGMWRGNVEEMER